MDVLNLYVCPAWASMSRGHQLRCLRAIDL